IATSVRPGSGASAAWACAARPSAPCSASATRSAAWNLPGESPPSSSEMSCAPTRAASSSGSPSTSVTAAEAAAVSAPQPSASKPAWATRSPSTRSVIRTRSPQAAPPAAPSCPPATGTPRPAGAFRCSAKRSRSTPPSLGGLGLALAVGDAGGGAGVREVAVQPRAGGEHRVQGGLHAGVVAGAQRGAEALALGQDGGGLLRDRAVLALALQRQEGGAVGGQHALEAAQRRLDARPGRGRVEAVHPQLEVRAGLVELADEGIRDAALGRVATGVLDRLVDHVALDEAGEHDRLAVAVDDHH